MTRNTKEISLIQIRSGDLAQLPKALHQAEFGLAKDQNRLFIGNAINTQLANRTSDFPYQNLEILTEFSELKDYFKYSYENNIQSVGGENKRSEYKEFLPIVIQCLYESPIIETSTSIKINGVEIEFNVSDKQLEMLDIVDIINSHSDETHTYATVLSGTTTLTFICFSSSFTIEDGVSGSNVVSSIFGMPSIYESNILMPVRKVTEKMDDYLNITDFGVSGDGTSNYSDVIFGSLLEVYKNYNDSQFFRKVFFPAGTYINEPKIPLNMTTPISYPLPLVSNLHIVGEGIDRTIIKRIGDSAYPLFDCLNESLTLSSHWKEDESVSISNILIEDLTFDSPNLLGTLNGLKDVVFNKVKFTTQGVSDLFNITNCSNIIFNECLFENSDYGILINGNSKNITFNNCYFKDIKRQAIIFSSASCCNLNSNIFNNCCSNTETSEVLLLDNDSKYISIHQSQFDENIIKQENNKLPFIDNGKYNFCDTLDITTDERKHLRFYFAQPKWDFIKTLYTPNGEPILSTVDDENASLQITNDGNLNLISTVDGDTTIQTKASSNVIIGKSLDDTEESGKVIFNKNIDVNGNKIINDVEKTELVIKPAPDMPITIEENTFTETPYNELIVGDLDAIPNVAYVEEAANTTLTFKITSESLKNEQIGENVLQANELDLITFANNKFGDTVYLKSISINVLKPFYKAYKNKQKAVDYSPTYTYYAGDVVKSGDSYGIVKNTHIATNSEFDENVVLMSNNDISDISYIDIIASNVNNGTTYSLTSTFENDIHDVSSDYYKLTANIGGINNYGLNPSEFDELKIYGERDSLVKHQDKIFCIYELDTEKTFTPIELHNTDLAYKKYSDGFNYIYDMDRMIVDNSNNDSVLLSLNNFVNYTLKIRFADENGVLLNEINDKTQLNPGGEMIIRIEYTKRKLI